MLRTPAWILKPLIFLLLAAASQAQQQRVSQEAINLAVDRGGAWLLDQQRRDGPWGENAVAPGGHRDPRNDLTAFCTYSLIKCKVPLQHPAIERALTYLETTWPSTTYSIANQILLFCEIDDERREKRLPELVDRLIELQHDRHGIWGYPGHPSIQTDLSNTQYAVMALRAAAHSGMKISPKVWTRVAERVLLHQQSPIDATVEVNPTSIKPLKKAGFAYLLPNLNAPSKGYNVPNSSMTTAGLAILRIAEQQLGSRYPQRLKRKANIGIELGFRWLRESFSVKENVAGDQAWIYYYLYGLQRLGALFEIELIGEHNWYWEGATELIKWQGQDGHWEQGTYQQWPRQPMPHGNTGYALLFLVKAMAPVTSGSAENRGNYTIDDPRNEVFLRASVRSKVSCWVSGFGEGVIEDNSLQSPQAKGMFVSEVRYYVDDKVLTRVPGDPEKPWRGERFAAMLDIKRNGNFKVHVGVVVRSNTDESGTRELFSEPINVMLTGVLEPWMLEHSRFLEVNLLSGTQVSVTASSSRGDWTLADRAIDGLAASRWLCKADDENPTLTLELRRAQYARALVLCQSDSQLAEIGRHCRVKRVALRINNSKDPMVVELDEHVLRPATIELPKRIRIRKLEIEILEFEPGNEFKSEVGFSEVGLLDRL